MYVHVRSRSDMPVRSPTRVSLVCRDAGTYPRGITTGTIDHEPWAITHDGHEQCTTSCAQGRVLRSLPYTQTIPEYLAWRSVDYKMAQPAQHREPTAIMTEGSFFLYIPLLPPSCCSCPATKISIWHNYIH